MRISDWSSDVCASDLSSGSTSSLTKASAQSSFAWYSGSVSKSHMRPPSVRQNGVRLDAAPARLEDEGGGYRVAMPLSTTAQSSSAAEVASCTGVAAIVAENELNMITARSEEHPFELQSLMR